MNNPEIIDLLHSMKRYCDWGNSLKIDAAIAALSVPHVGSWLAAEDVDKLVRRIDVLLNGDSGAAKQASLCDIAAQLEQYAQLCGTPILPVSVSVDEAVAAESISNNDKKKLWSLMRSTLLHGATIQQDFVAGHLSGYEAFSAQIDAAASDITNKLLSMLEEDNECPEKVYTQADMDAAVAAEREACAKVCEDVENGFSTIGALCAMEIRNRSTQKEPKHGYENILEEQNDKQIHGKGCAGKDRQA